MAKLETSLLEASLLPKFNEKLAVYCSILRSISSGKTNRSTQFFNIIFSVFSKGKTAGSDCARITPKQCVDLECAGNSPPQTIILGLKYSPDYDENTAGKCLNRGRFCWFAPKQTETLCRQG